MKIGSIFLIFFLIPLCKIHAEEQILPIGVADFPPFKYMSSEGLIIGSDTEIISQVFNRMNYKLDIRMQPWKRVQEGAMNGEFAAIYTFTKNPQREEIYFFSDPINTVQDVFFKLKSNRFTWETLQDLSDKTVGYSDGYNYHDSFKDALAKNLFKAANPVTGDIPELQQLKKLALGRLDIIICEVNVCNYLIKINAPELNEIDFIPKSIGDIRTFHVGFPRIYPNAKELADNFNKELDLFVKEGKRKIIFSKYNIVSSLP